MSNSNSSKQILLSVIGVAILVVAVVGVSFAFFNYTRTGIANTVQTGTISFSTSNSVININNLFPIAKTAVATDQSNVGVGTITITGHTNYNNGIDFIVTAEDVSSSIGTTTGKLPISINVSSNNLTDVKAYGSDSGSLELQSYEDGSTITSGSLLARGRIPKEANVNGVITIKAYIDRQAIAITDTLEGTEPASAEYENGTTASGENNWINGRTVMTTAEWNALSSTPASFKIKVVATEGV